MPKKKTVKAPYNFVPLAKDIFFPDWHDQVSHDVPFEDGLSGSFDLIIEAKTPIFTRDDKEFGEKETQTFLEVDGTPFIKGSSIRGMLREVIKIAGFGKMDTAQNRKFSTRDLTGALKEKYRKRMNQVKAGWLTPDRQLIPCSYVNVHYKTLNQYHRKRTNISWNPKQKLSKKYDDWSTDLRVELSPDEAGVSGLAPGDSATLVFTGHAGAKEIDFAFYDRRPSEALQVSDEVFNAFDEVHRNSQETSASGDGFGPPLDTWKHWKAKYDDGQDMPVFYLEEQGELIAFGLAKMFRLPGVTDVHGAIEETDGAHSNHEMADLAQLLFGYAPTTDKADNGNTRQREDSLKGRVAITHAQFQGEPENFRLGRVEAILMGPKASFFPAYLKQPESLHKPEHMTTWLDENAELAGWKRYPARGNAQRKPKSTGDPKLDSYFSPLDKGSTFKSRVYFHNLRPVELGALLWSLDFGGHIDGLVHRLGLARPYGYGEVMLSTDHLDVQPNDLNAEEPEPSTLKEKFEELMEESIGSWLTSKQVVHLLAMANPEYGDNDRLTYEVGPKEQGDNGFTKAKNEGIPLAPPDGLERTRNILKRVRVKRRRQKLQSMSELDKARDQVSRIVYEKDAVTMAREMIRDEGIEDEAKREALRQALYERYYQYWSKGNTESINGLKASTKKRKEYASWLEPTADAEDDDPNEPSQPTLSPKEADILAQIGDDPGTLKNRGHNLKHQDFWTAPGLIAFREKIEEIVPKIRKRKKRKKYQRWADEMIEYLNRRIEELTDQSDDGLDEQSDDGLDEQSDDGLDEQSDDGLDEPSESTLEEPSTA